MSSKQYAKGYRLERAAQKELEGLGWHVERRFMSKGGIGEDLVAWVPGWEDGAIMYVQCKADSRKKAGKEPKQGMMCPKEWNRFRNNVVDGDYCILANGTPAHIKWHEITGLRKEGLVGRAAANDISEHMRDFTPIDVHQWWDEIAEEMERGE